jgi:hypothetical protein
VPGAARSMARRSAPEGRRRPDREPTGEARTWLGRGRSTLGTPASGIIPVGSTGEWPSGKAPDSGSGDRRFESFLASQHHDMLICRGKTTTTPCRRPYGEAAASLSHVCRGAYDYLWSVAWLEISSSVRTVAPAARPATAPWSAAAASASGNVAPTWSDSSPSASAVTRAASRAPSART